MKAPAPCVLVPQHFGSLVFERGSSRYLPFDQPATELLLRLAGAPLHRLGLTPGELQVARAFMEAFEPRGFFTPDGRFAGDVSRSAVRPPPTHLLGPLAVHLEVVGACNLACRHCFAAPLPRPARRAPLELPRLEALFDELSALGSFRLGLTGGEPLLRRELLDIIDAAVSRELHPCLTTNGLLLDERWARELGRRELLWLNVSLDGATAATNDAVRGAGTFERVMERLSMLGRHARFTLSFTVMQHNAHEVEAFARLARDVGAATAVFRPLYPVGAARNCPESSPSFRQYSDALARLSSLGEVHPVDPFSPQARARQSATLYDNHGCGAANTIATVSVEGDVSPCSFLGAGFEVGNLRDQRFTELWNHGTGFVAMRSMSKDVKAGRFAGGCRARALAATGDADAADPWQAQWEQASGSLAPSQTVSLSLAVSPSAVARG